MKQIFTLAVALLSFAATTKAAPAKEQTASFSIAVPAVVTGISVSNGINVVLVEDATGDITVTGEGKYIDRVEYTVVNGTLIIKSKRGDLRNKVTVTVPVNNLRTIEVYDDSSVSNKGWLQSNLLTVKMKGPGNIKLCNRGNIVIESDDDIDLLFDKWYPQN